MQSVALREVPERGVARDDVLARAVRETPAVGMVECSQVREQRPGVHRSGERVTDLADDVLEQDGLKHR